MNILILGGVAAGTKTAAKLKREDRSLNVTILTKDKDISYAGCGLPYYVGGLIENREELIVNTPESYAALTGVEVLTGREAISVDSEAKTVVVRCTDTGEEEIHSYDRLVIATGASPAIPPIEGVGKAGVYTMRTPADAIGIRDYVKEHTVRNAVVVGGGFIGLEVAENLQRLGLSVAVLDVAGQILPGVLDSEMANYVQRHLTRRGIRIVTGAKAEQIQGLDRVTGIKTSAGLFPAELVILSAGIRPNTAFLQGSGIEMIRGAIVTGSQMETNLPDVYAAGDCALVTNRLTGQRQWSPMGSSANLEGRTLAQGLAGRKKTYPGVLGTGVVKLPGLNCGRTGLTEAQAKEAGYDVATILAVTDDKAHYYPDAAFFITKLIADRKTHQLLGMQVLGPGAVDKMVDIAVTGLNLKARLEDFENADYAYAPPFSTAIHPFVQAVYLLLNKLDSTLVSMTPAEYAAGAAQGYRIIDVAPRPAIPGATFVDLSSVQGEIPGIGKEEKLLLVCVRAKRAYFLQNRLRYYGYRNTVVLEGATSFNEVKVPDSAPVVLTHQG